MSWRLLLTIVLPLVVGAIPALPAEGADPVSRRLAPCPDTSNCVSSDATDPSHYVPPFSIVFSGDETWRRVREAMAELPRTVIVEATDSYLRAECKSALFGFIDDLELELRPDERAIAVRSASRTGQYDFGVNRRRVERLRSVLKSRQIAE